MRLSSASARTCLTRFNPRTYEGATSLPNGSSTRILCFNPRTYEGATFFSLKLSLNPSFQSTHLRRCDYGIVFLYCICTVSIHAPTKVRLSTDGGNENVDCVSIHAPTKVRPLSPCPYHSAKCFNPRTYEGATPEKQKMVRR